MAIFFDRPFARPPQSAWLLQNWEVILHQLVDSSLTFLELKSTCTAVSLETRNVYLPALVYVQLELRDYLSPRVWTDQEPSLKRMNRGHKWVFLWSHDHYDRVSGPTTFLDSLFAFIKVDLHVNTFVYRSSKPSKI